MRKIFPLLLFPLPFIAAFPGFTQTISPAILPDKAIDYTRLARVDSFIDRYVREGWVNGAVTIIVHDGHLVQYKGYGYSNIAAHRPMRRDDLFRIASQTK